MPGSYAPTLAENRNAFLRLLKKKGFKEESMTTVGLCVIGTSTTLESNKSHVGLSSPRWESSPTTFFRGSVAIGYNEERFIHRVLHDGYNVVVLSCCPLTPGHYYGDCITKGRSDSAATVSDSRRRRGEKTGSRPPMPHRER